MMQLLRIPRGGPARATGLFVMLAFLSLGSAAIAQAPPLMAGAAKVDITNRTGVLPVNDPLHVRALVIKNGKTTVAIITLDVVALGEIGYIGNDFVPTLRRELERRYGIPAEHVIINASHCHGVPCKDVLPRTLQAVKAALARMTPVRIGVGRGREDRIMINRRVKLKDGKTADVRHAYSLPPSEEIAEVGPVDPEIGVLRLDSPEGRTVAVVYNFACHPIQGVPSGGNTADITGFSSKVIEENTSPGTIALFLQGCAGDINPIGYKVVDQPRDAETLGNLLGLSTLRAVRAIRCAPDGRLRLVRKVISLPRADPTRRIAALEEEQKRLLAALRGTTLSLETFLPLVVKYRLNEKYPSGYAHRYLHERKLGRRHLDRLDAENLKAIKAYIRNIEIMEELTRLRTNLALLRRHLARYRAAGKKTIDVEIIGLRVGDFVLTTFPGELTVQIGLNLKKKSPHRHTFVAGYTNGYIYYAPTSEQLRNPGSAQEDCDCMLAPGWQEIYEKHVLELLKAL